jgi:hypothetical protein
LREDLLEEERAGADLEASLSIANAELEEAEDEIEVYKRRDMKYRNGSGKTGPEGDVENGLIAMLCEVEHRLEQKVNALKKLQKQVACAKPTQQQTLVAPTVQQGDTLSVSSMCKHLLEPAVYEKELPSINSLDQIGSQVKTVAEMGSSRQSDLGKVTELLVASIASRVKAGTPDPKGVIALLKGRRQFKAQHGRTGEELWSKEALLSDPFARVLVVAYRAFRQQSGYEAQRSAKQMLSLIVVAMQELTAPQIVDLLSPVEQVKVGDRVQVRVSRAEHQRGRPRYSEGKVLAISSSGRYSVQYIGDKNTPTQFLSCLWLSESDVDPKYVRTAKGVYLSTSAVYEATLHAYALFPGAVVPPTTDITRQRISGLRSDAVANFVMQRRYIEFAEQNSKNVKKGVKYLLKVGVKKLWRAHRKELGAGAISWGPFLALLSNKIFGRKCAKNCVCSTCRAHGVRAFELLHVVLATLDAVYLLAFKTPYPRRAELTRRIDSLEEYVDGDFLMNVRRGLNGSSTWTHCGNLALGAAVDSRLACPCDHQNSTDVARPLDEWGEIAKTVLQYSEADVAKGVPWNDKCNGCNRGGKDVLLCAHCQCISHNRCLPERMVDPLVDEEWVCAECQQQKDGQGRVKMRGTSMAG